MKKSGLYSSLLVCASSALISLPSQAAVVSLSFEQLPGSVAQGTTVFRADLSGLTLDEIVSLTLSDSNSGSGGSPGAFSGFDLDAIKLSTTLVNSAVGIEAAAALSVFDFSPSGTIFSPGTQRPPAAAKLNGTDATGMQVDDDFATLASFDAIFFAAGSLTLGDGGVIAFNFTSPVPIGGPLYLYIGEVGLGAGEGLDGSVVVSDVPIGGEPPVLGVPEPSSSALLMAGLGAIGWLNRRKRQPG